MRTVDRRGKSLIPVSRIAIEESRRESEERNEATEADREAADDAVAIVRSIIEQKMWLWKWEILFRYRDVNVYKTRE